MAVAGWPDVAAGTAVPTLAVAAETVAGMTVTPAGVALGAGGTGGEITTAPRRQAVKSKTSVMVKAERGLIIIIPPRHARAAARWGQEPEVALNQSGGVMPCAL